jgi:hypothetical protein
MVSRGLLRTLRIEVGVRKHLRGDADKPWR